MKKLFIGMFIVLAMVSFKSQKNKINTRYSVSLDTISTLNGLTESQANARITFCVGTADNGPKNTQVWFRKEIVEAWYTLLQADIQNGIKPDGIRIYIGRSLPSSSSPLHYNNGIVVVSTKYNGFTIDSTGKRIAIHADYLTHPKNAALFLMSNTIGEVRHDSDSTSGSLLYNTCNCDGPACTTTDHDITRSQAEKMVQHFHRIPIFRRGPINSKAEWFGMDMIEELHKEMQDTKCDGVRIYFARGVDTGYTKRKAKFVFVTTTSQNNGSIHKDYFDCSKHQRPLINKIMPFDGGGMDNGELCPDHCDGLAFPQQ